MPGLYSPLDALNYKGFCDLPEGGGVFMKKLGIMLFLYLDCSFEVYLRLLNVT